ncbi:hypothetical protein JIP62_09200 [Brevundimonas vitis]|uniref:Lipoprotein n=1 Tax=Brevundimonas vitisensis TaxID=2800818 RepID=A0ABX7BIZ9_9CAUL|nr:hypothetical protein [Brevundimonas vitisensis]QQQ17529.1 hypothetical protein JIP62_09200 [Brevundimonas vitisensis]
MRILISTAAVLTLGLTASACATGPMEGGYNSDLKALAADCQARQGILVPTGAQTGRAAADNACQLRGVNSPRLED